MTDDKNIVNDKKMKRLFETNLLNVHLENHRTFEQRHNFVSMGETHGKYLFDAKTMDEFYNLYNFEYTIKQQCLAEKSNHNIPLIVDVDIKLPYQFKHTQEQVESVILVYQTILRNILDKITKSTLYCALLEKEPYQDGKNWKHGFHLHFPYCIMSKNDIQLYVIPEAIKQLKILNLFQGDVIDDKVCDVPWLMYGSSKDKTKKPYLLTQFYSNKCKKISTESALQIYKLYNGRGREIDNNDLVRIFSLNKPHNDSYHKTVKLDVINVIHWDTPMSNNAKPTRTTEYSVMSLDKQRSECILLIDMLSNDRADDRLCWLKIGWILNSLSIDFLDIWKRFSEKCPEKYLESVCDYEWQKMKHRDGYGLTVGSLYYMAKMDNPNEYNKIRLLRTNDSMIKSIISDCTHTNLAEIFAKHCDGEMFYTNAYGWILFDKKLKTWSWNNDKTSLVHPISKFFRKLINTHLKHVNDTFEKSQDNKEDDKLYKKNIKKILDCRRTVSGSSFSRGIIDQIVSIITEKNEFIDKFDSKANLFAFSDGKVIDLNNGGIVRDIVKEDYIMTTCGYPYPKENKEYIDKVNVILSSLTDDKDQLKSILTSLSLPLWGRNKNEVFIQYTGSGGNGKGLCDAGISKVYGNYYKSINSKQLTQYEKSTDAPNSELASCRFARVVMSAETEDENQNGKEITLKTPTVKKWTGGDPITTRFLNKNSFTYVAKFVLMSQLNELIKLSTNDEAIQRRLRVVELPFKFVKNEGQELGNNEKYRDENLKSLITTDEYRDALFYILLNVWIENKGVFYESSTVKSITNDFFESQNPVKIWFDEFYEKDSKGQISATQMLSEYKTDNFPVEITSNKFGSLLKKCCNNTRLTKGYVYHCKRVPFTPTYTIEEVDMSIDDIVDL